MESRGNAMNNGNQPLDVQSDGRLPLALNESAGDNPTPQQVIDAVGSTLELDACGIFPTRSEMDVSVAVYFRTDAIGEAFMRAYTEKAVGVDTVRSLRQNDSSGLLLSRLPSYVKAVLSQDAWSTAIRLHEGATEIGLLWMIGSPDQDCRPPTDELVGSIGQLGSLALQRTLGHGWALSESHELKLLEELSGILTRRKPLEERLHEVAERAREASGFATVGLATPATSANAKNIVAFAMDESVYSRSFHEWATQAFASEEVTTETKRLFEGRRGPMLTKDPGKLPTVEEPTRSWLLDNDVSYFVHIPLFYDEEFLGSFRICSTFSEAETWERLRVFTALANHIAAILKNLLLFNEVQQANASLTASHYATVRTLAYAAEARDPFTGDHLKNIEAYTSALGAKLELNEQDIEALRFGAILHDVGKLRVPDSILLKPGKLDEEEWTVIRQHPLYGEEILLHSNIPRVALQIARWHHERWDGRGYPDGITGDAIPLAVQIVTVADVFDALTSTRPYKHAWPADQALAEIEAHSGTQFSPLVVEAFRGLADDGTLRDILAHHVASPVVHPSQRDAAA